MDRDRRPHRDVEQARQEHNGSSRSLQSATGATSIRLKLGNDDVKTKRFLNHLTRFHYLKRRLDKKAKELLSSSFLNNKDYASRGCDAAPQQFRTRYSALRSLHQHLAEDRQLGAGVRGFREGIHHLVQGGFLVQEDRRNLAEGDSHLAESSSDPVLF